MWGKKTVKPEPKPVKECPSVNLDKAEQISKQYKQLGQCCSILADIRPKKRDVYFMSAKDWRIWESEIGAAGIDIEEVYAYIGRLAEKRRIELELELEKLGQ